MPGLIRGVARTAAVVGTATVVSNGVSRRQQGRWAAEEQQPAPQPAPPPAETAASAPQQQPATAPAPAPEPVPQAATAEPVGVDMNDTLAQLKQLGELKTLGVLTDAEFETQKQKILGS